MRSPRSAHTTRSIYLRLCFNPPSCSAPVEERIDVPRPPPGFCAKTHLLDALIGLDAAYAGHRTSPRSQGNDRTARCCCPRGDSAPLGPGGSGCLPPAAACSRRPSCPLSSVRPTTPACTCSTPTHGLPQVRGLCPCIASRGTSSHEWLSSRSPRRALRTWAISAASGGQQLPPALFLQYHRRTTQAHSAHSVGGGGGHPPDSASHAPRPGDCAHGTSLRRFLTHQPQTHSYRPPTAINSRRRLCGADRLVYHTPD
jgi:hypothetical protein